MESIANFPKTAKSSEGDTVSLSLNTAVQLAKNLRLSLEKLDEMNGLRHGKSPNFHGKSASENLAEFTQEESEE
jgi:hypothetical protein